MRHAVRHEVEARHIRHLAFEVVEEVKRLLHVAAQQVKPFFGQLRLEFR